MNHDPLSQIAPKLVVAIVDRSKTGKLENLLSEKHVHLHYLVQAMGTARSEVFKSLGLSGTEKTVCICMQPGSTALPLMNSIADRMSLTRSGNGVTFIMPLSGASAAILNAFGEETELLKERLDSWMDTSSEGVKEETKYALVISVINHGFSEVLMDAVRSVGARGGTIIHARRSGTEDGVKFFGVTLQAEKEIVAIVVPHKQKKELMQAVTKKCGLNTEAHGIVFSVPIENCSGIDEESE